MKTVAQKIRDAINRKGFSTVKECAQTLSLPYELLRKVVGEDHIPKDEQLLIYARKLGIDPKRVPASVRKKFKMHSPATQAAGAASRVAKQTAFTRRCGRTRGSLSGVVTSISRGRHTLVLGRVM